MYGHGASDISAQRLSASQQRRTDLADRHVAGYGGVPNACRHHSNGEHVQLAHHATSNPGAQRLSASQQRRTGVVALAQDAVESAQRLSASQQRRTGGAVRAGAVHPRVPNACRHHSNGELHTPYLVRRSSRCPTPVGITATANQVQAAESGARRCAQRLSASQQRGTAPLPLTRPQSSCAQRLSASQQRGTVARDLDRAKDVSVLNACRHHSNGELASLQPSRRPARGAQRLSASQQRGTDTQLRHADRLDGAQRLSASQQRGTHLAHAVCCALFLCPTPVGITATGNQRETGRRQTLESCAQRLSASQQRGTSRSSAWPRCSPSAQRLSASQQRGTRAFDRFAGVLGVPNACRHHSNGERGGQAALPRSARCPTPVGITATGNCCPVRYGYSGKSVCPTPVGITATGNSLRQRTLDCKPPVPKACRHHSNGEHIDPGGFVDEATNVPNACRHHSNGELASSSLAASSAVVCPTPVGITATGNDVSDRDAVVNERVPNACRHHSNGELAQVGRRKQGVLEVPNACRHHSNGERHQICQG